MEPSKRLIKPAQLIGNGGNPIRVKSDETGLEPYTGGGAVSIPATSYASNADAVAALGVGVLYKTTTVLADGVQPVLSVTV